MKVEELMINDWVKLNGSNYQVQVIKKNGVIKLYENTKYGEREIELNSDWIEEFIEPIPLTEEILKKNGFENIPYAGIDCNKIWLLHEISYYGKSFPLHTDDIMLRYSTSGQCWRIFFNIGGVHSDFRTVTTIFYVHELQHLLKLCKIEKEIALQ